MTVKHFPFLPITCRRHPETFLRFDFSTNSGSENVQTSLPSILQVALRERPLGRVPQNPVQHGVQGVLIVIEAAVRLAPREARGNAGRCLSAARNDETRQALDGLAEK